MSRLKEWFQTKYKIVPVYTTEFQIYGYKILSKFILAWLPVGMYEFHDGEAVSVDNIFKSYDDALNFLKHETTVFTNEKIPNTTNN